MAYSYSYNRNIKSLGNRSTLRFTAISILACAITISMIDKLGRKPFLVIGSIGMTLTFTLLVFAFGSAGTNVLTGNLDLGDYGC